jgi:hypothetical protein
VKDFCIEVENNFSPSVLIQLVQTLRRIWCGFSLREWRCTWP